MFNSQIKSSTIMFIDVIGYYGEEIKCYEIDLLKIYVALATTIKLN